MKLGKKLFVYILVSVLIALFITSIFIKVENGYFEYLAIALTNSQDEIAIDNYTTALESLKKDFIENEEYYKDMYDHYISMIPENIENKDMFIIPFIANVVQPTLNTLSFKYNLGLYAQALTSGIILGILVYVVINANFKFSWLKLILGFIICLVIAFLTGALIIGIKNVVIFHLSKYIFVWNDKQRNLTL